MKQFLEKVHNHRNFYVALLDDIHVFYDRNESYCKI